MAEEFSFLDVPVTSWVAANDLAFAMRDGFPVSKGHTLVIPKRLVTTWFDATRAEQLAILDLVDEVKAALDRDFSPDGYNVGFNAGAAAGQTVMHLHVHVIPRYRGDTADPRGGVRGVIPDKQKYALLPARVGASQAREQPAIAYSVPAAAIARPSRFAGLPAFVHGSELHFEKTIQAALRSADHADMLSAFVQVSGVQLLVGDLADALAKGCKIRFLTGDYLGITSAHALRMLWRLACEHPGFDARFYETPRNIAFHPKSYVFLRGEEGVAYVGSSNLSRSALQDGIEWNLRLVSSLDEATFNAVRARFEQLFHDPTTKRLTPTLIDAYEQRAPVPAPPQPEARAPSPVPNEIQREALDALKKTRRDGHRKGLIVLATGLGKTYLSAFDFNAMGGERALFIAHREEILSQAKNSWEAVFPDKVLGTYDAEDDHQADVVFASVQTLSRPRHLARFREDHFDYIVVDEFHHAAAQTYRKILAHFKPRFLLGLTATPDRLDGRSLLDLCDDNLVYRRDLIHGISRKLLVPFHYFGIKDTVDYEPIPWRSGKFEPEELTKAVATEQRAEHTLREYKERAPASSRCTLCFCCTTEHADFMRDFFRRQGIKAASVHSGPGSDSRAQSLRDLKSGDLEIICAVDVFNEGLDVPDINTVLMLRPTESPVVFLQQLGRGLRLANTKPHLTVIDFIGNHRSFLTKPQSLVFLLGGDLPPLVALQKIQDKTLDLPEGCLIDISVEAIDLLRSLVQTSSEDILVYEYLSFRDAHGRRPTAKELFDEGVNFAPLVKTKASWFQFVREQGDLTDAEETVVAKHEAWFGDLLRTRMTKAYKMLALRALLDADVLFTGMDLADNARAAFNNARSDLLLFRELREDGDGATFNAAFERSWRDMPLKVWARGESTSQPWFSLDGDRFAPTFVIASEHQATFEQMTEEMVELRLAQHRDRLIRGRSLDASEAPIVLTVSHANQRPILRFDRSRRADIPPGPTFVEVDRESYVFDFKKVAVNVVTRDGQKENVLATLMRKWLGPTAGLPGTRHQVRLIRTVEGWRLEPDAAVQAVSPGLETQFPALPYFADLAAACGALVRTAPKQGTSKRVPIRTLRTIDPEKHFVVRASGDSMDGGDSPISDGDLVLCEWMQGMTPQQIQGQPTVLLGTGTSAAPLMAIKIPRRGDDGSWTLESWNAPPQPVPSGMKLEPIARVLEVVEEPLGLVLWGEYNRDSIAAAFGSVNNPSWKVGHRDIDVGDKGHTILMVTLRKAGQTKVEHRYADQFVTPSSLQWDSQASTTLASLKGRRIVGHEAEGRTIHLFVQYDAHSPFTYFGPLIYSSHEGEKPMHVAFRLVHALPDTLWKLWGR